MNRNELNQKKIKSTHSTVDYTLEQLELAFNSVRNAEHWKNPIDKVVPLRGTNLPLIAEAIYFYTSTMTTFIQEPDGMVRITAPGYYQGPAN
jgi:hypothetical protein